MTNKKQINESWERDIVSSLVWGIIDVFAFVIPEIEVLKAAAAGVKGTKGLIKIGKCAEAMLKETGKWAAEYSGEILQVTGWKGIKGAKHPAVKGIVKVICAGLMWIGMYASAQEARNPYEGPSFGGEVKLPITSDVAAITVNKNAEGAKAAGEMFVDIAFSPALWYKKYSNNVDNQARTLTTHVASIIRAQESKMDKIPMLMKTAALPLPLGAATLVITNWKKILAFMLNSGPQATENAANSDVLALAKANRIDISKLEQAIGQAYGSYFYSNFYKTKQLKEIKALVYQNLQHACENKFNAKAAENSTVNNNFSLQRLYATACATINNTYAQNKYGNSIKDFQKAMGLTSDGKIGPKTTAKIKEFQTQCRLESDGQWGPDTDAAWQKYKMNMNKSKTNMAVNEGMMDKMRDIKDKIVNSGYRNDSPKSLSDCIKGNGWKVYKTLQTSSTDKRFLVVKDGNMSLIRYAREQSRPFEIEDLIEDINVYLEDNHPQWRAEVEDNGNETGRLIHVFKDNGLNEDAQKIANIVAKAARKVLAEQKKK